MKCMSSFGSWLKTELLKAGMQQKDLCRVIGITEASMSRYIHGERIPRSITLMKIMDYFGAKITYGGNEDPYTQKLAVRVYHPNIRLFECGECGSAVMGIDKFCHECGKPVGWT